jgi:ABC-type Fe3+-hydroxamate transport system substrate-binding protein
LDSESMSVDNSRDYYLYGKGTPPKYLEDVWGINKFKEINPYIEQPKRKTADS